MALLLAAQPAAQRGPLIRWLPTTGPLGGESNSIFVHAGQLIVPLHNDGRLAISLSRELLAAGDRTAQRKLGADKGRAGSLCLQAAGPPPDRGSGAPWVTCGAVPRPPGSLRAPDRCGGRRSSISSWMSACFDRAIDVRPGRLLRCREGKRGKPSMSCFHVAR